MGATAEHDILIVGADAGGGVPAVRQAEDPRWRLPLVGAGPDLPGEIALPSATSARELRVGNSPDEGTEIGSLIWPPRLWANTYFEFDLVVPCGGIKHSGYGRENRVDQMEAYSTTTSAWMKHG